MIQGFIQWASQNQSLITLFFTALVAISTVVYAVLTWRLVQETKMVREAQIEPRIAITLEPEDGFIGKIFLKIENIGMGPAYDVKFDLKPDFEYEKGRYLSEVGFIKNGISYLSPKQPTKYPLAMIINNNEEKIAIKFEIRLKYRDCLEIEHEDKICCDFSQFKDMRQWGKPPLYNIANSLDKIEKHMR